MKNKKVIIIILVIIAILIVAGAFGGFLYFQIMKNNQEEYDNVSKKYERIVEIANKVNTVIDEKVKSTNDFVATNTDVRRR